MIEMAKAEAKSEFYRLLWKYAKNTDLMEAAPATRSSDKNDANKIRTPPGKFPSPSEL